MIDPYKPIFTKLQVHLATMTMLRFAREHKKAMGDLSEMNFGSMLFDTLVSCN